VFRNHAEVGLNCSYLVEAAWIAIRKIPKCKIITGNIKVKRKSVIIKVAHKMARRILSVIKTETAYQINRNLVPIAIGIEQ
jgi:hypothetical protein